MDNNSNLSFEQARVLVIDYWCNLFTEAGIKRFRDSKMLRYAFELFHMSERIAEGQSKTPETFLKELSDAGVEKILIPAFKMGNPYSAGLSTLPAEWRRLSST